MEGYFLICPESSCNLVAALGDPDYSCGNFSPIVQNTNFLSGKEPLVLMGDAEAVWAYVLQSPKDDFSLGSEFD